MKQLSIIVPSYNVEAYLPECIDSLLSQSDRDKVEVIIINDGSTDNTLTVASTYCQQYPEFIHIVDQKNQGLSSSRNVGIDASSGDYILFLDSDDYLAEVTIETLLKEIKDKPECQVFSYDCKPFPDTLVPSNDPSLQRWDNYFRRSNKYISAGGYTGQDFYRLMFDKDIWLPTAWLYVYKKSFLNDSKLKFKAGIFHEDELFTAQCLLNAKSITYIDKKLYCYRVERPGSIMNSSSKIQHRIQSKKAVIEELNNTQAGLNCNLADRHIESQIRSIFWLDTSFKNYLSLLKYCIKNKYLRLGNMKRFFSSNLMTAIKLR